jgi:hypothetical protein
LLLMLTVIGLPVALVLGALYLSGMLYATVLASCWMGEAILRRVTKRYWRNSSPYASMMVGAFLFVLIISVPLLGWLAKCLLLAAAFGALLRVDWHELQRYRS